MFILLTLKKKINQIVAVIKTQIIISIITIITLTTTAITPVNTQKKNTLANKTINAVLSVGSVKKKGSLRLPYTY